MPEPNTSAPSKEAVGDPNRRTADPPPCPTPCPHCGEGTPSGRLQGLCPACVARQATRILSAQAGPAPADEPAQVRYFGDYELLEEIAHGGMGVVWKARQLSLHRLVAVKLLLGGQFSNPEAVHRFRTESQAAANLQHPHIVAIHEVGEHQGQHYFSMDLIEGGHLGRLARDQPLPARRAAALMQTIAEAVHYAHQRGVIHRDLKPSNVLIDHAGQPRVTDFGLAKRLSPAGPEADNFELTMTGQVLGTPAYMSPEQAGGQRGAVTTASDIYSLGALLYFLLTGRAPFVAGTIEETLRLVHEAEPVPPQQLNPAVPRDLATICLKCLRKEAPGRYASAQELAGDLARFLNEEPILARPLSPPERLWRWCRRRPALAGLVLAVHLVGAVGLAGILWQWDRARQAARQARAAQDETLTNLWHSYVAQARANRLSGRPGRRFDSLAALTKAAALRRTPELRNEAIAALALTDIHLLRRTTNAAFAHLILNASLDRYATATPDGGVRVGSTADDRELARLPATGRKVASLVRFSPDDRQIAVRAEDGTLQVWDLATARPTFTGRCAEDWGGAGADFSPDNRHLALADGRLEVTIHDLATGEPTARHPTPMPAVCIRYSANGRLLAVMTRSERAIAILDADTGRLISRPDPGAQPYAMAWRPDAEWLAIAASDRQVHLWDARANQAVRLLRGHNEDIMSLEFAPKGCLMASVGFDGLRLWDWRTGQEVMSTLELGQVQISSRGDRLGCVAWGRVGFSLYALAGARPVARPGLEAAAPDSTRYGAQAVAFSPAGRWLAYASGGELSVFDGLRELATIHVGAVNSMAFDAQSNLWVAGQGGCSRWPLRAAQEPGSWTLGPPSSVGPDHQEAHLAASPDGRRIVVCREPNGMVIDVTTGQAVATLRGGRSPLGFVAISPDGDTIATCGWYAPHIRIWNAHNGSLRTNLTPPQWNGGANAAGLAFSPDGRWLLVSALQPDSSLWSTRDWSLRWSRPREDLASVLFSPDGSLVALREAKRFIHLVAPESGETLAILEGTGADHPYRMGFSPDGTQLAVCGMGTRGLTVWDLRALRQELAVRGLDWDRPPYPAAAPEAPVRRVIFLGTAPNSQPD